MKLATFTESGLTRLGVVIDSEILDIGATGQCPNDMLTLLTQGTEPLLRVRELLSGSLPRFPLSEIRLEAPLKNPRKFLGLGASYQSHLDELAHFNLQAPKHQTWFNKQVTCIIGPYDDIHFPAVSDTLDYEGELAIVIGKRSRHLTRSSALNSIAGFTICNDVSVREWQQRASTAMIGKSFDTHGPLGPWIVTADELANASDCALKTWVNGELRQNGRTSELLYRFEDMLVELTTAFTLEPGDILSTGSPAGVGVAMRPPRYLKVGDVCRVEVEGIGFIENRVIAEPSI
jgi:2-keto-4-pentenoate hydratase/2-oxohepta-3-ene-1,7-dioic acid hydratase in catechol pathway